MNRRSTIFWFVALGAAALIAPVPGNALSGDQTQSCQTVDEATVKTWFDAWNKALKDRTARQVVSLYADDATLLPTIKNGPYTKGKGLEAYFIDFVKKDPVAKIEQPTRTIEIGCNVAYDIGLYDFTFKSDPPVKARYTFIYKWDAHANRWLIAHHHSSKQPQ